MDNIEACMVDNMVADSKVVGSMVLGSRAVVAADNIESH